jgi:hypothetical protein
MATPTHTLLPVPKLHHIPGRYPLQPAAEASAALKEPSPRQERRRNGNKTWRGFCQRRLVPPGQVLNHLA